MEDQTKETLDLERDELSSSIMDKLSTHHSSFEVSDIPMYLAKYRVDTLRTIAEALEPCFAPDADPSESKYTNRFIRAILNVGKERFVLTALKSMSFFTLAAEASGPQTQLGWEEVTDPRMITRNMEKVYRDIQFGSTDDDSLWDGHSHDADHYSSVLNAQHLANSIKLEAMFPVKMDYFMQIGVLAQNIDRIEPVLSVVMRAAKAIYGKSKTMPDGSGRRKLLDAQAVIDIAEACQSDESKQMAVIALIEERGVFDRELFQMVTNSSSPPLAEGIL